MSRRTQAQLAADAAAILQELEGKASGFTVNHLARNTSLEKSAVRQSVSILLEAGKIRALPGKERNRHFVLTDGAKGETKQEPEWNETEQLVYTCKVGISLIKSGRASVAFLQVQDGSENPIYVTATRPSELSHERFDPAESYITVYATAWREYKQQEESKPEQKESPMQSSVKTPEAALAALQSLFNQGVDEAEVRRIASSEAQNRVDKALANLDRAVLKIIEFPQIDAKIEPKEGEVQHPEFERLARYIAGGVTRIWVTGEAGTGKTHAVRQIATALDRPLYTITPVVDKYELFGYCDANGSYVTTQLYQWAVDPNPNAILLLDEIDGCQASALVAANAVLANGFAVFPGNKTVEIAPTKCVIATANTTGEGPTLKYSARLAQDGALLDRFEVYVHWGTHEPTERAIALSKAPYESTPKVCDASVKVRKNIERCGIELSWGPRRTYAMARAVASGDSVRDAALAAGLCKLDEHGQNRALDGVL